jgi:hypothetical protein
MRPLSRTASAAAAVAAAFLMIGCASASTEPPLTRSPSPTATFACPEVEGVELPPECIPYDPEQSMAQNDRHRERTDLDQNGRAEAERAAVPVTTALEALRADGALTGESVEQAIRGAGLTSVQVRDDYGRYLFGATAPAGGCVFGEISTDTLSVEVGGFILDGGCLAMQ